MVAKWFASTDWLLSWEAKLISISPEVRCVLELRIQVEWSQEQLKEQEDLLDPQYLTVMQQRRIRQPSSPFCV